MTQQQVQDPAVAEAERKLDEANAAVEQAQSALGTAYKAQDAAEEAHLRARQAAGLPTRERVPAMLVDALEQYVSSLGSVSDFEMVDDGIYGFLYAGLDRQLPISLTINVTE